jgi:hypothetical protein
MAPGDGYAADTMLPDPLAPGDEYSGNAVLAGALEFTGSATVAKDVAFVVKTADGTFAKVKVRAYEEGMYTIDWAYAGPGQTAF